jgi:hypothetical protein
VLARIGATFVGYSLTGQTFKSFDAGALEAPNALRASSTVLARKRQAFIDINRAICASPAKDTGAFEPTHPIYAACAILAWLCRHDAVIGIKLALLSLPTIDT